MQAHKNSGVRRPQREPAARFAAAGIATLCVVSGIASGSLASADRSGELSTTPAEREPRTEDDAIRKLAEQAAALRPMMRTDSARSWLDAAAHLQSIEQRQLYIAFRPNRGYTQEQFDELSDDEREVLRDWPVTSQRYYSTFYGTPIAYARAIDLAAEALGDRGWEGVRVLDLGYGQIGQLRMLAMRGADVTGVEVDPILTTLYSWPGDTGEVEGPQGERGSITLHEGLWPNDESMREAVGGGYDVFISRNLLKYGYVKPAERIAGFTPVADGMSDEQAVRQIYDALAPGGVAVIYNIGPAPDPAKPWSDIRTPWSREVFEAVGFEVIAYNADENEQCRAVGERLGWGDAESLAPDLFGTYTVARRPGAKEAD